MLSPAASQSLRLHQLCASEPLPGGPRSILLTEATGQRGARLLDGLLRTTDAVIVCVLRDIPGIEPLTRIATALERACGDVSDLDRVAPVLGDIEAPQLGLPRAEFESLTSGVDGVVYGGAQL